MAVVHHDERKRARQSVVSRAGWGAVAALRVVAPLLVVVSITAGVGAAQEPPAPTYKKKNQTPTNTTSAGNTSDNRFVGITPDFERKHNLRYLFAPPPKAVFDAENDLNRPHSLYQFTINSVETIQREAKESVLAFDFSSELLLTATPRSGSDGSGRDSSAPNLFDLHLFPYRFTATEMRDGQGSRVWHFDPRTGLTQTYRDGRVVGTPLDERYVERQSLRSAVAQPMVLPLRNGALVGKPMESAFMKQIRLSWVGEALVNMLPPLPALKLTVGRKWQAGIPIQMAGTAEPVIVRCNVEFRSYDPQTGMAEIGWEYSTARLQLTPMPGIHHIDANSVASVKASGVVFLHAPTGWVRSADTIIRASILNTETPSLVVDSIRTMHLQCHDTPKEILNWADHKPIEESAITNAEN